LGQAQPDIWLVVSRPQKVNGQALGPAQPDIWFVVSRPQKVTTNSFKFDIMNVCTSSVFTITSSVFTVIFGVLSTIFKVKIMGFFGFPFGRVGVCSHEM